MKLIVGGLFAGKWERLQELGFSPEEIADCRTSRLEAAFEKPAVYRVNALIRRMAEESRDMAELLDAVRAHPEVVVVCDEVGCGVVPADPLEREYRERVGRFCCEAAKMADSVERVWCGIVTELKAGERHGE
ncbi:MAG: bifunctional adenosylcobinamide kinase/adenosylcobinamide-phosphate guanylyltransferase [Candidatus Merdivicinus sp.]